ncbi:MAG: NADH-quinone oxidoreductase subunit [Verrucomicrobiota bacterium]|jgi:NADH-quinone oxidoreductase subunit N
MSFNYSELLTLVAPELILVLGALGVLFVDLVTLRGEPEAVRRQWAAWLAVLACATAGVAMLLSPATTPPGYLDGMLALSPLAQMVKIVILVLTACTALLTLETRFTAHLGEYMALLLLATVGMMFLVATDNLLLLFVSLELLSLCLYILTAFNKRNPRSAEAALKYFLFGGMAAAFLLFGLSLIYGLTGQLNLTAIATRVAAAKADPLLLTAMVLVVAGFGFKVAAVPFHLWAPDAYEGAPVPSAAFIASGSKVASFFILAKVMAVGLAGATGSGAWGGFARGWMPVLAVLALLSVVVGNLAALVQGSVRRLLAYSAIAQAGYLLVGVLAADRPDALASVLYYVTTYALTTVGAFGVVAVVQEQSGSDRLEAFAGLSRRAPGLALCMLVFLLSLAGIPPLAGFFGKFYLFKAGLTASGGPLGLGLLWLIVAALALSAVSLYYYLQVLKQIYVAAPAPDAPPAGPPCSRLTNALLGALALAVLILGCVPEFLVSSLRLAARAL